MSYRIAKSLAVMREQFNAHAPKRSKASDGWIGDAKHAASTSDHNPWVKDGSMGVVTALDITHDPQNKVNTWAIAEHMRMKRDPRIKYVISNGRIFSSTVSPWVWRKYTGSNPHSKHVHISVNSLKKHYDDHKEWDLGLSGLTPSEPSDSGPDLDEPKNRPVLRRGSKGEEVKVVQRLLVIKDDGDFGPITDQAVKDFQHKQKLVVDGVVGPKTWAKLDLIEQIPLVYEPAPRQLSEALP